MRNGGTGLVWAIAPVLLGACGGSGASVATPPGPFNITHEIRDPAGGFLKGSGESVHATAGGGKLELEVKDRRVYVSGKDRGALKNGDSILLDTDGKLTVNGEPRP